ncbi:hypothetical protein SNE510_76220 [Streptomyces sp. NE5-10]|uniref:hypothetical protein n=1 Tax=Streptomyces sp. NE5-10 TaxID=2759674 RepID=UPI001902EFE9|nr:hypothetical protein [Streptomyces sp. NE5-10]GHJ98103.1 hypothetical protein SNE510_76220 [Streptomyces sp. NE5-10]
MAHLIFDEGEQQQLRTSAREHAAGGEGLLAYALEQLAAEGIDLSKVTPYADVQARYGLGDTDAARTPGAA